MKSAIARVSIANHLKRLAALRMSPSGLSVRVRLRSFAAPTALAFEYISLTSKAKVLIVMCAILIAGQASAASFEGASVPTSVRTLMCNASPRIVVQLANATTIWYPADWESSKFFLATALAAKAAGQKMYYLGTDDTLSFYCVGNSARQVLGFGLED